MEWVETTGRTVEAALDAALDQLGVHEDDAEFEVLEAPKKGLLGRFGGSEARIRARIRPISREKPGARRRGRNGDRGRQGGERGNGSAGRSEGRGGRRQDGRQAGRGAGQGRAKQPTGRKGNGRGDAGSPNRSATPASAGAASDARTSSNTVREARVDDDSMPVEEQAGVAAEFVSGIVVAMGLEASIRHAVDDETVLLDVDGDRLGLLVGPRGATLHAIEELARAVVQHESGGHGARVRLDVGGYKAKRRAALEDFTRQRVREVVETGEEQVLEAMSSSDRKVVHDTAGEMDGVETLSEGEDPRRYVVIRPA